MTHVVDVWPPLAGLGAAAVSLERSLGREPPHAVAAELASLEGGTGDGYAASLLAGAFALSMRSGADPVSSEAIARACEARLRRH